MRTSKLLLKIANTLANPARRMFMLGAAGTGLSAVGSQLPAAAGGAAVKTGGFALANTLGLALPGSGVGNAVKAINGTSNTLQDVAKWRMYRMNRKAGIDAPEALAKTYAANKATGFISPVMAGQRGAIAGKGVMELKEPVTRVMNIPRNGTVVDKTWAAAKNLFNSFNTIGQSGAEILRHYK